MFKFIGKKQARDFIGRLKEKIAKVSPDEVKVLAVALNAKIKDGCGKTLFDEKADATKIYEKLDDGLAVTRALIELIDKGLKL